MVSMLSLMSSRLPQHFRRASPLAKTWSCKLVLGQRSEDRNAITPGCRCKTCENLKWSRAELGSQAEDSFHAALVGSATALGRLSGHRGICELSGLASIQSTRYPSSSWSNTIPAAYLFHPFSRKTCRVKFHCCFLWEAAVPDLARTEHSHLLRSRSRLLLSCSQGFKKGSTESSLAAGEGEHKIMEVIRSHPEHSHCLCSNDADALLLFGFDAPQE